MSLSLPSKAKVLTEKQISDLSDADLSEIFKQLPPYERLIASEVCSRWQAISSNAWLDVSWLDLSPIPGKHIGAIVRQCPNLRSVFAVKKCFDANELACLSRANQLSAVKFYDCTFAVMKSDASADSDGFQNIFCDNLQHASWDELVLHDACVNYRTLVLSKSSFPKVAFSAAYLPASLTRLHLSGLRVSGGFKCEVDLEDEDGVLKALDRLQNLECLILHSTPESVDYGSSVELMRADLFPSSTFERICALKSLRELCIGPAGFFTAESSLGRLVASLPKLEVLFLNDLYGDDFDYDVDDDLKELITTNSALRILVLTGPFCDQYWEDEPQPIVEVTVRKRFPHGFSFDPLPLLHIFVGKQASERICFAKSTSDAAVIYPINRPMPEFLAREDIAPIFEGVWIAEKIKEAAKHGGRLWNYEVDDTAISILST